MPQRLQQLKRWLETELNFNEYQIEPASADASFRRYFRVQQGPDSYIVMDAPTEHEDSQSFVQISAQLSDIGLNVPTVFASDLQQGFLLLSDFGQQDYLGNLNPQTVDRLYGDAMGALISLQACGPDQSLPRYDENLLLNEMNLFEEWLLKTYLEITLSEQEKTELTAIFQLLMNSAQEQPQVCVHRDYHSRNLMQTKMNNPGILDYQDAVVGPITYDLVSLLRDCYIQWPTAQVKEWALGYRDLAMHSGLLRDDVREKTFMQWFDWMGLQRHLKVAGIFARLNCRDGKDAYLENIPLTLKYIVEVATHYKVLKPLAELVETRVLPCFYERRSRS